MPVSLCDILFLFNSTALYFGSMYLEGVNSKNRQICKYFDAGIDGKDATVSSKHHLVCNFLHLCLISAIAGSYL